MLADYSDRTREKLPIAWTYVMWITTGILWSVWLQQDMSNIAVFLPRSLNIFELLAVVFTIVIGLGIMLF